jgi:hypothetical protein
VNPDLRKCGSDGNRTLDFLEQDPYEQNWEYSACVCCPINPILIPLQTNEELDNLKDHKNAIHFIKAQRLRWLGHVERMLEERDVKKIYKWRLIASRPVRLWMDTVMKGIQAVKTVNWKR